MSRGSCSANRDEQISRGTTFDTVLRGSRFQGNEKRKRDVDFEILTIQSLKEVFGETLGKVSRMFSFVNIPFYVALICTFIVDKNHWISRVTSCRRNPIISWRSFEIHRDVEFYHRKIWKTRWKFFPSFNSLLQNYAATLLILLLYIDKPGGINCDRLKQWNGRNGKRLFHFLRHSNTCYSYFTHWKFINFLMFGTKNETFREPWIEIKFLIFQSF